MTTTSFVQIFVINRLLFIYPKCRDTSVLFNNDESDQQQQATKIMTALIKMPINKYIVEKYKNNESAIVSLLYTKMMGKYPNEYQSIISFDKNCIPNSTTSTSTITNTSNIKESRYYENKLFNQSDLAPQIFQYLLWNELNNCCLVNSVWLYHGYDVNSLCYLDLLKLAECHHNIDRLSSKMTQVQEQQHKSENSKNETSSLATTTSNNNERKKEGKEKECLCLESSFDRCLQRVVKVKKIHYFAWRQEFEITDSFVEIYKSLNLHNLESIDIVLRRHTGSQKEFVNEICHHVSNVKYFALGLWIVGYKSQLSVEIEEITNNMSPVYLNNAEKVELEGLLIPVILTNKCKSLTHQLVKLSQVHENGGKLNS